MDKISVPLPNCWIEYSIVTVFLIQSKKNSRTFQAPRYLFCPDPSCHSLGKCLLIAKIYFSDLIGLLLITEATTIMLWMMLEYQDVIADTYVFPDPILRFKDFSKQQVMGCISLWTNNRFKLFVSEHKYAYMCSKQNAKKHRCTPVTSFPYQVVI